MAMEGQVNDPKPTVVAALQRPPGRQMYQTYIVQFPKNQVYRVPPRENALFMEQFRNPATAKKTRGGCCCCCCCERRLLLTVALIVVAVIAVVGMTLATLYLIFNPTGPTFNISNLVVKSGGGGNKTSRTLYKVSLRAKNPNEKLGFEYEEGYVSLLFEGTKVAAGRFPMLHQSREESNMVTVEMSGPSGVFHRRRNGGDSPVVLTLEMNLAVRIRTAGMETWLMRSYVVCEFEVSSLRKDTQVLSEECKSQFRQY